MDIRLSHDEFREFRDVQIIPRWSWPATFSCNNERQVWPYATPGYTRFEKRLYVDGWFTRLDEIVRLVLMVRHEGGRFNIDNNGVRLAESGEQVCRFVFTE